MNNDKVLALIEAGFTTDQIKLLIQLEDKAAPAADNTPDDTSENVTPDENKGAEGQQNLQDPPDDKDPTGETEKKIDAMLETINETLTKIQQNNLRAANPDQQTETVDDILARVINPKTKEVIE